MNDAFPGEADIRHYRQCGYVPAPGLLPPDRVVAVAAAVDRVVHERLLVAPLDSGYDAVFVQVPQARLYDQDLDRLALDGRIARAAGALVGVDRVRLFLDQILYKQPGARPTRAHADAPYLSFDDTRSVNCWIAIDAAGPSNGAMQYYAGSHAIGRTRLVHLDREDDDLVADEPRLAACPLETVACQPGDAVFHSSRVVHRAFANLADTPRRAFSIQYMPDGATYNGWLHPFLEPYRPRAGNLLDYNCLPLVYPAHPEP